MCDTYLINSIDLKHSFVVTALKSVLKQHNYSLHGVMKLSLTLLHSKVCKEVSYNIYGEGEEGQDNAHRSGKKDRQSSVESKKKKTKIFSNSQERKEVKAVKKLLASFSKQSSWLNFAASYHINDVHTFSRTLLRIPSFEHLLMSRSW